MILGGKEVAEKIYKNLEIKIGGLKARGVQPFLAVILVGEDPASLLYVRKKEEKAEELGIGFKLFQYPAMASQKDIINLIDNLNHDTKIHGIIVQLPLPEGLDTNRILSSIDEKKDIELISPAALAILEILAHYNIDLKNKKIVLVGHGKLVGQPLEKLLLARGVEPEICDSKTQDLSSKLLPADIIISAVGKPGLISADMISEKATIIDAGTAESNGSSVGDIDPLVYSKAQSYSPVPGGVGPVTVVILFKNLIEAAKENQ